MQTSTDISLRFGTMRPNFRKSFQNSLGRNITTNSCSAVQANTGEHTFAPSDARGPCTHTFFDIIFNNIVNFFSCSKKKRKDVYSFCAAFSSLLVIQFTKTSGIFKVEHLLTFYLKHELTSWINERTINVNMTILNIPGFVFFFVLLHDERT